MAFNTVLYFIVTLPGSSSEDPHATFVKTENCVFLAADSQTVTPTHGGKV